LRPQSAGFSVIPTVRSHPDAEAAARPSLREPVGPALKLRAAAAALGLAAVAVPVLSTSGLDTGTRAAHVVGVALPVGFGLFRLAREPKDRFALLLVAVGSLWSLTTLAEASASVPYSAGRVSTWLIEPAIVFLILSFPFGRLESAGDRRLVAGAVAVVAALYLPSALLAPYPEPVPWAACGTDCPANAFQLTAGSGFVTDVLQPLREVLTVLIFAAVTLSVARRALRSGQVGERILMPVAALALVRCVALAIYLVERRTSGPSSFTENVLGWAYVYSLPLLTVAFAGGIVAHRLFLAEALERLAQALSSRPTPREMQRTLSEALRDPLLQVLYWMPQAPGHWVDANGWPVARPRAAARRAITEVVSEDRLVAAIVHDEQHLRDRALLQAIRSYVVTALESQHLVTELQASLDELSKSRARLVTVADEERRRIERDLHDGAQQRLVALQIKLELLAERLDSDSPDNAVRVRALEDEISVTLDEVRRFGRGLYPPLLADRGLSDALHAVARSALLPTTIDARLPHRYPREVESAVYFACMEALQNATKHARGATAIRIAVSGNGRLRFDVSDDGEGFDPSTAVDGNGLTNIRDRIGALGGTLEIDSAPGRGTRVTGMIPLSQPSLALAPR
jgi:signal transduction histidine kinase